MREGGDAEKRFAVKMALITLLVLTGIFVYFLKFTKSDKADGTELKYRYNKYSSGKQPGASKPARSNE